MSHGRVCYQMMLSKQTIPQLFWLGPWNVTFRAFFDGFHSKNVFVGVWEYFMDCIEVFSISTCIISTIISTCFEIQSWWSEKFVMNSKEFEKFWFFQTIFFSLKSLFEFFWFPGFFWRVVIHWFQSNILY